MVQVLNPPGLSPWYHMMNTSLTPGLGVLGPFAGFNQAITTENQENPAIDV